jgi:hypothetical protein
MQLAKDRQPLPETPLIAAKNLFGAASRTPEELANIVSRHCQPKTLRDILSWELCGSCARLGRGHFPPDRE